MPKLSPDARAVLERFRAERSPGPARRHRNYEATLDRLDEDPLPAAAPHGRTRRIVGVAAAAVLVVGVAVEDASTADANITAVTFRGVALTAVPNSKRSGGGTGMSFRWHISAQPSASGRSSAATRSSRFGGASAV